MNTLRVITLSFVGMVCGSTFAAEFNEAAGVTLFAFDSVAIPFSQNLRVEMRSPTRHHPLPENLSHGNLPELRRVGLRAER